MSTIEKFKEAALALQQDVLYKNMAAARKANDENEELQDMIGEFNLVRTQLKDEIEKDVRDEEKVAKLNEKINTLYSGIMEAPSMLAYNAASDELKLLVNHINAVITAAIDGEDPRLVQAPKNGECASGSCEGCSGC